MNSGTQSQRAECRKSYGYQCRRLEKRIDRLAGEMRNSDSFVIRRIAKALFEAQRKRGEAK